MTTAPDVSPRPSLRDLPTLLTRPRSFFETHAPTNSLGTAAVVVLVVALATTVAIGAVGWWFASGIDATTTETVMEPWPDSSCESFASMNETSNVSSTPTQCAIDEPKTKQVEIGPRIWDAFVGRLPLVFVSVLLGWILLGAALHVASSLVGGEGSFGGTLAVAGWSMLLDLLQVGVVLVGAYLVLQTTTFASDPAVLRDQIQRLASTTAGPYGTLSSLVVIAWQTYVWRGGLQEARNLDSGSATVAAGVVGVVTALFTLV